MHLYFYENVYWIEKLWFEGSFVCVWPTGGYHTLELYTMFVVPFLDIWQCTWHPGPFHPFRISCSAETFQKVTAVKCLQGVSYSYVAGRDLSVERLRYFFPDFRWKNRTHKCYVEKNVMWLSRLVKTWKGWIFHDFMLYSQLILFNWSESGCISLFNKTSYY